MTDPGIGTQAFIQYGKQLLDDDDKALVQNVLDGDWLTQGPTVERFEKEIADYVGAEFGVAFSSGSAALHASAWALGLGPKDTGVTSALTFIASPNAFRHVGAHPQVVDISPHDWNIDLELAPDDCTAVMPVHFAGLPTDLTKWSKRRKHHLVIEDASHALGAMTADGPVGNCKRSDITCFSFHPVKPITTGEGGLATTNNSEIAERLRKFRSHGVKRETGQAEWRYDAETPGFNYRMSDIHAALGLSQLKKLERFIAHRNEIAEFYRQRLNRELIGLPPGPPESFRHGYHLFPVLVSKRDWFYKALREKGIGAQVHYIPAHHHSVNRDMNLQEGDLPVVDSIFKKILSLPIHPGLEEKHLEVVVESVNTLASTISNEELGTESNVSGLDFGEKVEEGSQYPANRSNPG